MNIFFLSICARRCARYHFDKHVVKMILELCQLLSCAWHMLDESDALTLLERQLIYRKTHYNHPSAVWTRAHINNYAYVVKLALELCQEWRFRYGHTKQHASEGRLIFLRDNPPRSIPKYPIELTRLNPLGFTLPMPQAMPDDVRINSDVESVLTCQLAYRQYYMSTHKSALRSWSIVNLKYKSAQKTPNESKRVQFDKPYWFTN